MMMVVVGDGDGGCRGGDDDTQVEHRCPPVSIRPQKELCVSWIGLAVAVCMNHFAMCSVCFSTHCSVHFHAGAPRSNLIHQPQEKNRTWATARMAQPVQAQRRFQEQWHHRVQRNDQHVVRQIMSSHTLSATSTTGTRRDTSSRLL